MPSQERPSLTSIQNTRFTYISSANILHQTVLGRINKPDGRQLIPLDRHVRKSIAVGFRRSQIDAPLLLSGSIDPIPLDSRMAPAAEVIDLSKSDDEEDVAKTSVPAPSVRRQKQRSALDLSAKRHKKGAARSTTSGGTIDRPLILSSPEPPDQQQSHAKSRDLINGKAKNATLPTNKQASEHVHTRPSLLSSKVTVAPETNNRERLHDTSSSRKNSATSNHGLNAKRNELLRDGQLKPKSLSRPNNMTSKSIPSALNGSASRKRPFDNDRSSIDEASLAKKLRLDYVTGRTSGLQGPAPPDQDAKSVGNSIDFTGNRPKSSPPKGLLSRGTNGGLNGDQHIHSGALARAPPRPSSATSSKSSHDKPKFGKKKPLSATSTNGGGKSKSETSSSDPQSAPLRGPSRVSGEAEPRKEARQQDTQQAPDIGPVPEIPESAPASPVTTDEESSKQTSHGSPAISNGKTVSKPTERAPEDLFNRGFNSGRASSLSSRSERSSPINGHIRKTPSVRGSAAPSAPNSDRKINMLRSGGPTNVESAAAELNEPAVSGILRKDVTDNTLQQATRLLGQRKFPLSPSETSIEDNGRAKSDVPSKALSAQKPQETPQRGKISSLEIPDSAPESHLSTRQTPGGISQLTASPRSKSRNAANARSTALSPHAPQPTVSRAPRAPKSVPSTKNTNETPDFHLRPDSRLSTDQPRDEANKQDKSLPVVGPRSLRQEIRPKPLDAHVSSASSPFKTLQMNPVSVLNSTSCQIERIVGHYVEERCGDNEFWIQSTLKKARYTVEHKKLDQEEPTDVFAKLQPIEVLQPKAKHPRDHAKFGVELHTSKKPTPSTWLAECTVYETTADDVPNYSQYVSIKNNFLAYNDTTLQHWPYFGDEFEIDKAEGLSMQYDLDVREREHKLLCLAKAENLASYTEDILRDVGCQWSDVLYFLLDPMPDVGVDKDAKEALKRRDTVFCKEDFTRKTPRWIEVLSKLPKVDPKNAGKAALLCEHFQRCMHLQLWHVARLSGYLRSLLEKESDGPGDDELTLTCRVCMRYNCPYHGEMKEHADSEDEPEKDDDHRHVNDTDIVHPPDVNVRYRVVFPASVADQPTKIPSQRRKLKYWQTGNNASLLFKPDERGPFYPCHHPGEACSTARCLCFESRLPCEKSCSCPADCARKFQGCSCASKKDKKGNRMVCFETDECVCFQLSRECDPDLCGDCGVCDVLDPCYRHDDRILDGNCRNANIQRGVAKHVILGDSGVHGLGLYACENVREHDFVGEYKGEIVTKQEAERRGAVYEHQKLSYLFSLNVEQEIDSTHFGNKIRFINHASKAKSNLYPRVQLVNTVHRIALYGMRTIKAGEELFFDYGPMFPDDQLGGRTGKKTAQQGQSKAAPHVHNTNITKGFHEIERSKDEIGNVRARKAMGDDRSKQKAMKSANSTRGQRGTSNAMTKRARSRAGRSTLDDHAADDTDVEMNDAPLGQSSDTDGPDDAGLEEDEYGEPGRTYYDINKYNVVDDTDIGRAAEEKSEDDSFDPEAAGGSDEEYVSADTGRPQRFSSRRSRRPRLRG